MRFPEEADTHEKPRQVFIALLEILNEDERNQWQKRWEEAEAAERVMRDYNRAYDESLLGITRYGQ